MKRQLALAVLALAASQYALANCKIDPDAVHKNFTHAQAAVNYSEDANLAAAAAAGPSHCTILEGWHNGGYVPPNLPNFAKHIKVRNLNTGETCHVFEYPKPNGHDFPTTCW
ncbi:MAG: hypothetical protein JO171_20155 [Paludibacterium sp.]|uniref:hypothetical protein n=1 Tax=Paludibacterium sp. TaxID=1917523 RepID=UPI0025FD10BE|nr:hypothetical protein [Paludibacterium sp.]MBV8049468.1 hypothetical protein [Paludibacterium sp.]MBV8648724.1 hypothetical protein [Paludibacterium sp.]